MKKKMLMLLLFMFGLIGCADTATAKHLHKEKWYQDRWCEENRGKIEYVLYDMTRVDCLTEDYAYEFDFASKQAEAIGQSLYYSALTGRMAGIVLIIEEPKDYTYYNRLKNTIKYRNLNIKVLPIKEVDVLD